MHEFRQNRNLRPNAMQRPLLTLDLARRQAAQFLGVQPAVVEEQAGGLSGARVWRVESPRGTFALRQYPTVFPTEERLRWLHQFLKDVQGRGCKLLPCPVPTNEGATWIRLESQFWEMLTWVHGESLLETKPTRELLISATVALADLHRQLRQIDHYNRVADGIFGWPVMHSYGLRDRLDLLESWFARDEKELGERFASSNFSASLTKLFDLQRQVMKKHQHQLDALLRRACAAYIPIFPVLRDVQPAHVLFEKEQVSGFIDVGAMRYDSPMADLARLLQRWRYTEPTWYADAFASYQNNCFEAKHRKQALDDDELTVFEAYDFSARLLTGVQWLRWIVLEEREFANHHLVEQHWQRTTRDYERLLNTDTIIE